MSVNAPPKGPHKLLRVAVYAGDRGADWLQTVVPGRPFVTVHCESVAELGTRSADLAVAWARPEDASALAAELAQQPGAPPCTLLVGREPHEHPQARMMQALVGAKREWEAAFDALVEPMALLGPTGRVVRSNHGLARAFGRDVREIIGLPVTEFLGRAVEGEDPLPRSLEDGEARSAEVRYAGLAAPDRVSLSPLRDETGAFMGLVLLLEDLTQEKENQELLFQTARLADVGHLAAGVAHEINTPLASIAMRAQSLRKAAQDPALCAVPAFKNFARYLQTIEEETFRCKKIIRALLEFSARRQPEKGTLDLNSLVEHTAEFVEHQFRVQQVRLELRLGAGLGPVPADEGQVRQVLVALLMNALDASKAGGDVSVATAPAEGGFARFSVEDRGEGIPREIQDRIFNPFFTTKPFGQGTGLGLSICHGIVTAHGGDIRVESEPGCGTRMLVSLPMSNSMRRQEVAS